MEVKNKEFIDIEKIKVELDEYKRFAFSKNFFALALSMIMAETAHNLVASISEGMMMPLIGFLVANTEGNWRNLVFSPANGLNIELGKIFNGILEFSFTSIFVYVFYIKIMRKNHNEIIH